MTSNTINIFAAYSENLPILPLQSMPISRRDLAAHDVHIAINYCSIFSYLSK